jgi:Xaa-Pro aminopeptidase
MSEQASLSGLTQDGCEARRSRLITALTAEGFDAALLVHPGHISAFSGHWTRGLFRSLLLVVADGNAILATPVKPVEPAFVTHTIVFPGAKLGTMLDDPLAAGIESLAPWLSGAKRIGSDGVLIALSPNQIVPKDITPLMRQLRRSKLPDEIALIERGVHGCEAAYAAARAAVGPGRTEWDMYVDLYAAAARAVGEPIGEFGNDFQAGTPGGPPRHRAMQVGELLPLDLSVVVRGYWSDLCRTFCVGGRPTAAQSDSHRRVADALGYVESTVRPGTNCRQLYLDVANQLKNPRGWVFPHHLGHGIGLSAHEAPRLNPHWDDVFQEGDVFTAEPGLYAEELRGGVRLEKDYLVTAEGVRPLSGFPLDL